MFRTLLAVGALVVSVPSCVDPEGEFDAFAARVRHSSTVPEDAGDAGDAGTCTVAAGAIDGDYALALSVSIAPTKPIVVLAHVTTPDVDGGAGLLLDAQPLLAADRRTPTGDRLLLGPFAVSSSGEFRAEFRDLQVTGAANPITGGDIAATVVLTGNLCGDPASFCGTVEGQVTQPIELDLAGSTFTMSLVADGADPPPRPPIDCSGTLADPL